VLRDDADREIEASLEGVSAASATVGVNR